VLDRMITATKPGGWIVVSDVDWIQYDAQPVPEPFATLSRVLRELSSSQHGYDGTWGRMLVDAFTTAPGIVGASAWVAPPSSRRRPIRPAAEDATATEAAWTRNPRRDQFGATAATGPPVAVLPAPPALRSRDVTWKPPI